MFIEITRYDCSVKSDHLAHLFTTCVKVSARETKKLSFRKWKDIRVDIFQSDLSTYRANYQEISVFKYMNLYKGNVNAYIVTLDPDAYWCNDEIRIEKRKHNNLENNFGKQI